MSRFVTFIRADSILAQNRYSKLVRLNANNNSNITSLRHINDTLLYLKCGNTIGVIDKFLNRFTTMETMHIIDSGESSTKYDPETKCGVDQKCILELTNLIYLECRNNKKIANVNHLAGSLEYLDCSGKYSGIFQNGISELKYVHTLFCDMNINIYDFNHMGNTLKKLCCSDTDVKYEGIKNLSKLEYLDCSHCAGINNIDDIANISGNLTGLAYSHLNNFNKDRLDSYGKNS